MKRQIPTIANWLLQRFGVTQQNQALVGDLAEEYQSGRPALWLWWQIWMAIAATVKHDLGSHKLLALRAIATGWCLFEIGVLISNPLISWLVFSTWSRHLHFINMLVPAILFPPLVLIGWLVARTHRQRPITMVLAFWASMIPGVVWGQVQHYYHPLSPMPHQWVVDLVLTSIGMMCILLGGLLQAPAPPKTSVTSF